jgi:hypothetical protein
MSKKNEDLLIDARPTKEFFIYMLTKDIPLVRAIIDLVDNSWDGALRVTKKHPLDRLSIQLSLSDKEFIIKDNCGGISFEIAKKYAFRFGRPTEMERTDKSVGQFGVGMKRALFKLGKKFRVESNSSDSKFVINVDVDEWVKNPVWEFRFNDIEYHSRSPNWEKCGTTIVVSELHKSVAEEFASEIFISELRDAIKSAHQQNLGKGIVIKINETPLEVDLATLKCSGKLKPGHFKMRIDTDSELPVQVDIFVGVSDSDPQAAGWNVYCNGRMILESDGTNVTGWGEGSGKTIPRYHNQFARFRGHVFLECDDASKLPWNTTKTGVDENSPIYEAVRQRMIQVMRPVIDFLNRLDGEKEILTEEQVLTKEVDAAKPIQLQLLDMESQFESPTLQPDQQSGDSTVRITYKVSLEKLEAVKSSLGASSNKEAGEKTFEYYYDLEC